MKVSLFFVYFLIFVVNVKFVILADEIDQNNTASNATDENNSTNPNKTTTTKTKNLNGSFLKDQVKQFNTTLPENSILKMVFLLSKPGVNRNDGLVLGSFDKSIVLTEEDIESGSTTIYDVFRLTWSSDSTTMNDTGLLQATELAKNINLRYKDKFNLITTDPSEIVFTSVDRLATVHMQKDL